jgi:hypothetical protein
MVQAAAVLKRFAPPALRPGIFFLPFLFLYIFIILFFQKDELTVDEPSYLSFANNLLQGFYSPPPPDIDLWHAPGYPLVLSPFIALKAPLTFLRLLNAVWLYASLLIFYKLLTRILSLKTAIAGTTLLGMYWLAWKGLPVIMTETFVFFLITVILYAAQKYFENEGSSTKQLLLLGFMMGYLCLTKFLFGYTIIALMLFSALQWARGKDWYRKAFQVSLLAFLFTVPWLIYTYSLTGRVFYWSNSGGANLYWMSSTATGEWGDWFNENLEPNGSVDGSVDGAAEQLQKNHGQDMQELLQHTGIAKDDLYKQKAIENIRKHPGKFLKNWMANTSRLLFNFPYSYRKTGPGLLFNALPHILTLLLAIPLLIRARKRKIRLPFFLQFLLILVLIYFAGSTLLSALIRMFYIVFPVIACTLLFLWQRTAEAGKEY